MLGQTAINHGQESPLLEIGFVLISTHCLANQLIMLVSIFGAIAVFLYEELIDSRLLIVV
jgi:hypothetical protein